MSRIRASPWQRAVLRRGAGQSGQTLPLLVLFMTGLLGVCGLVIDVGNLYEQHHQTQAAADAAALASADAIPSGTWQSAAQSYAGKNDKQGDQVSTSYNGTDSVTVTVTRQAPTYVAKLFGFSTAKVVSSATATIQAVAQVNGHIAPYAVTTQVYANGSGTVLFNENAPGAYGTIDLPATDNTSGGSCSGNTIPGTSPNIKAMLGDTVSAGQLVVGGCVSVKSGAAQPSGDVINSLPGSLNTDLQSLGNGFYQVIPQSWDDSNHLPPRLLFVPIVDTIPGGNGSTTVKQFAWFYATSATGGGNTLTINGVYVSMEDPIPGRTIPYVPGTQGQILTSALTS
jgi:Flp pilus assembly protein TadG